MRRRSVPSLFVVSLMLAACGGSAGSGSELRGLPHTPSRDARKPAATQQPALRAHRFAEVSDVIGPYVGRDGDASLAVWAEASGAGRSLSAAPIDAAGLPGAATVVGQVAPELDLVLVRGLGAASARLPGRPRFAVVTSRRSGQKTHLEVAATSSSGQPLFGPAAVAERSARVLWVGLVVTGETPLLLWAEQPASAKAGEPATLLSLPFAPDKPPAAPAVISARACVWQVAAVAGQAAIASVKATGSACSAGSVTLDLLAASGKVEKSVELGGRAALDLDLVASPDAFVLAWSDVGQVEPRAYTAIVDARGAVRHGPGPALAGLGEQAVLALASGGSAQTPAFLVWENLVERPEGARFFHISALDARGKASAAHARILYERVDGGAPELVPHAGGIAALTLASACDVEEACEQHLPVPTFVALDKSLRVQTSEPLVLDALGGRAADLGWGLTCHERGCFALAAPSRSPAPLFTVPLPIRESRYRAAAEQVEPSTKPRVVASDVLLRAPRQLAQLALGRVGSRELLGYVTDFDPTTPWQRLTKPAEDGRFEPLRARIAVRAFEQAGARAPVAEEQPISLRAHSLGGLTLLSESGKDALALWTGLDKGEPQVFLTLLSPEGKRGQQRMLTRKSGGASDVTGLPVDGGYLVSWIDERSGDSEVYAARVSRSLERASPEQRITSGSDGAASELVLTQVGGKPYAIWSDARAAEEPGWSDIYGAFLRPSDAARDGAEHRLSSTRPHSFSPQVSELGGAPLLAWLEEADGAHPASVRLVTLGNDGEASGSVSVVAIEAGAPRGLGLACTDVLCRVALTLEVEGRAELHGFEWRPSTEPRPMRLATLSAPSAASVAPLVSWSSIYVADARDDDGLVRRLDVEW